MAFRYEFKKEDAENFASHIHMQTSYRGSELVFTHCPYCKGGQRRDRGTFAINLETGLFNCQRASCGQQGNMWQLARDFDFKLTNEFTRYYEKKPQYKKLPQPKKKIEPKETTVSYLESRGISKATAEAFGVTSRNDNPDTLVFPVYNIDGKMVNVKYRNTKFVKGETKGSKEWFETGCEPYLYGVNTFTGDYSYFCLTEGEIDALSLYEAGVQNCFSVLGGKNSFTWYPACYEFLDKFETLIVFGDYEHGKITLLDDMKQRFRKRIKHIRPEDYKDCKDANELLQKHGKEAVKSAVDNAVYVPLNEVIEIADVEEVDIFKLPKLETGINQLDRLLYGGIPFGGVTLVSGKPGQGKSTLASQIIINAIMQGHKCFAYSGELPNYLFKAWMSMQVAGAKHIYEYSNKWGDTNYNLSDANKQLISEWYRGKMFLYDNRSLDGDEHESLCKTIEKVILQYGVDVILLDNLMTAIDLEKNDGSDKYEKQSQFIKKLSRLALRHNAIILLVAHKRKNNFTTDENDEISGSGDIANLALLTIAYEKSEKIDESQRLLKVSKNRLFGKTYTKGYTLDYDPKSKRIFGECDDKDKEYGWDIDITEMVKGKIDFEITDEEDVIPFD